MNTGRKLTIAVSFRETSMFAAVDPVTAASAPVPSSLPLPSAILRR